MALAGRFGGGNGRDLVEHCASRHPSERVRFAALRAQASEAGGIGERLEIYRRAASEGGFVGAMAARRASQLEASRKWMEAPQELVTPLPG
jgi:hypothetical protein